MIVPSLTVFTGPMFGSKTSRLISACERFQRQGLEVAAFKPLMDVRYGDDGAIRTHNGHALPAVQVESGQDIAQALLNRGPVDVVAVDEMFMIPGAAESLIQQFRKGVSVVVASIQMSASLTPFGEMAQILPWATDIHVCAARCDACGEPAYFTAAKKVTGAAVFVGGGEVYSPRCFSHFQGFRDV